MIETVLSMGLDVGTTTTILVISKLTIKNLASAVSVPRIEIVAKEIAYAGRVHETPFLDEETIDEAALMQLILAEYASAGVKPAEVHSGAVIVTGQAALKSNAENVLHRLAVNAGRFVVASAGPHLEAIIAGRGSGAAERSRTLGGVVANLDIGGGTTNIAFFSSGEPRDALATNVGARLIRMNPATGAIEHITPEGLMVLDSLGMRLKAGDAPGLDRIRLIARRLASVIEEVMNGSLSDLAISLAIGQPRGARMTPREISFSGGVGSLVYEGGEVTTIEQSAAFGDLGPALAEEMRKTRLWAGGKIFRPGQTIYATVIGAGAHMTELSGSTIFIGSPSALPLRNVPVVKPFHGEIPGSEETVRNMVMDALGMIDAKGREDGVALSIGAPQPSFGEVMRLARGIDRAFRNGRDSPVIIVTGGDFGKVLGQALKSVDPAGTFICIDQVGVESGDYIDIGEPLYSGSVVPVVVKTLVFSH